jgi:ATP-dependent DNA helicase RecQ
LFEEAGIIEEERIAPLIQWSTNKVVKGLQEMEGLNLVSYRRRSDEPLATLLVPRRDAQLLMLERESLTARKERAMTRLDAVLNYAFGPVDCRSRVLLAYFGEPLTKDCGTCDRCKARARDEALPPGVIDQEAMLRERWRIDEDGDRIP